HKYLSYMIFYFRDMSRYFSSVSRFNLHSERMHETTEIRSECHRRRNLADWGKVALLDECSEHDEYFHSSQRFTETVPLSNREWSDARILDELSVIDVSLRTEVVRSFKLLRIEMDHRELRKNRGSGSNWQAVDHRVLSGLSKEAYRKHMADTIDLQEECARVWKDLLIVKSDSPLSDHIVDFLLKLQLHVGVIDQFETAQAKSADGCFNSCSPKCRPGHLHLLRMEVTHWPPTILVLLHLSQKGLDVAARLIGVGVERFLRPFDRLHFDEL
ncbi:hypothetical protein PENTCL1PPCAC_19990, partial [Pristionchus entomophagus]